MNLQSFLAHHQLADNPFTAEEARLDPVFAKLGDHNPQHPDFGKVLGRIDQPATAVVFGEKGSGKTAIRIDLEERVRHHNAASPERRILTVAYDDLNPVLDQLLRSRRQNVEQMLKALRLEDHQDAILSQAVTKWVEALLHGRDDVPLPDRHLKRLKKLPKEKRRDLAVLAMLYDHPTSGDVTERFTALRRKLRLRGGLPLEAWLWTGVVAAVTALVFLVWYWVQQEASPRWVLAALALSSAGALAGFGGWAWKHLALGVRARRTLREMPAVGRTPSQLKALLAQAGGATLAGQPLPQPASVEDGPRDNRYQLTRRFLDLLCEFGYAGVMVLIDRIDEPTVVSGDAQRMRAIVWPMFDNKFLKQDGVGLKLLLPLELSYLLSKEDAEFYQHARLDKQNMIEQLTWSGATLYDLCTSRLNILRPHHAEKISLTHLFHDDVSRDMLVDALDQMHQPRDAFKFMYQVIQEHCRLMPDESADFRIARLTLDAVRRQQSQRVQELYRGLSPA